MSDHRRRPGSAGADVAGRVGSPLIVAPFHPIFVHFTIALTAASLAFDLTAVVLTQPTLATVGWWTLAASAVATPATIISGIVSRLRLPMEEGPARSYLRAHMTLGPVFLGVLMAMTVWRAALWERTADIPWIYLATMGGTICLMTVQGYLGGELVYRFGAEVRGRYSPLPTEPRPAEPGAVTGRAGQGEAAP